MKTKSYDPTKGIKCPICGRLLIRDQDDKGNGQVEINFCSHVTLWYNHICGEMVYVKKGFKPFANAIENVCNRFDSNTQGMFQTLEQLAGKEFCTVIKYEDVEWQDPCCGGSYELIAFLKQDKL